MLQRVVAVLAVAVLAVALLTGCASLGADTGDASPPPAGPTEVSAELTIVLDETGDGPTRTFTLTCDPGGGDHPDPDAACAALARAGGSSSFAPTPADVACTEQWGGPQVATVEGTVAGEPVSAWFTRVNGCEISRWDALAPLLASTGGAV